MPNYKTHSIHATEVLKGTLTYVDINPEEIKKFAIGPDTLLITKYKLFDRQHYVKTRVYFETLLKLIKEKRLYDNSQVMAFLYGQLCHYVLDLETHPLIYYETEKYPVETKIPCHAMVEMWIDDLIMDFYNIKDKEYYKRLTIEKELEKLINELYLKVFHQINIAKNYDIGYYLIQEFDRLVRNSDDPLLKILFKLLNIGDIFYSGNIERVKPFLNLNNDLFYNPETGEPLNTSFIDSWNKSIERAKETINDVNDYIYKGKQLINYYINNNISYTGSPCKKRTRIRFFKEY